MLGQWFYLYLSHYILCMTNLAGGYSFVSLISIIFSRYKAESIMVIALLDLDKPFPL